MKKFIRELRRREVFRTAGLYVGLCWILIEVANIVLPTFDAPDWSMRAVILTAIIGFPIMLVLAWVYDVTERGIVAQADATDTIVAPIGTRKMDFVVIGILSVALIISVYLNVTRGPGTDQLPELVSILIADFDNQTGDAVFDGSLEQALQIGLESAPFVNTYQRSTALGILSQIQPDATRLTAESARLIAVREGIDIVLAGTIKPDGSGYKIEVSVFDGATGNATADEDDKANSKLEVLEVVGSISGSLRKDLGDASVGYGTEGSVETFTAASIEAARDYTLAQELAREGKPEEAIGYYASAVEKDPNFGRALSGWALTLFELGRTDEANALWDRAIAQQGMMTERERLRTLGLYYMAVSNNYEKAIESYESLVTQYPADGAGHNNLAVAYFSTLNFEQAMQEGLRVLEIYPARTFYMQNFALYAMYAGEFDLAEARGREVIDKDPGRFYAWLPVAIAALSRGDFSSAESAYDSMTASGDRGASLGNLGLADLALYRGQNPHAIELLRQGIAADESAGDQRSTAAKYIALAEAYAALGDKENSILSIEAAQSANDGTAQQVTAAMLYLQFGNVSQAMEIGNALHQQLQPHSRAYGSMILGIIDSQAGRHAAALDRFRAAIALSDFWLVRFHFGQAYLAAGSVAEALDEFTIAQNRRGEASALFLDDLPTWRYLATLPYWLGRAQQELGMAEAARQSYQAYIDLRGESDPLAQDARQRIAD